MAITNLTPLQLIAPQQLTTAAAVYYTGPSGGNGTVVKKLVLTNVDTVNPHMVTVYLVPSAGTPGATNTIVVVSIPPNSTYIVNEFNNQVVPPSSTIQAKADTAAEVVISCAGFTF